MTDRKGGKPGLRESRRPVIDFERLPSRDIDASERIDAHNSGVVGRLPFRKFFFLFFEKRLRGLSMIAREWKKIALSRLSRLSKHPSLPFSFLSRGYVKGCIIRRFHWGGSC